MAWRRPWHSREVLVGVWLVVAFGFLWVRLPGFWRSPFQRFEEARRLDAAGNTAGAIDEMVMALDEDPSNVGFLVYAGNLQLRAGQRADAERAFARALREGSDIEASLGLAAARRDRPQDARQALDSLDATRLSASQQSRRLALYASIGAFGVALGDPRFDRPESLTAAERRDALRWAMADRNWPMAVRLAEAIEATVIDDATREDVRRERGIALRALGRAEDAFAALTLTSSDDTAEARAELAVELGRFGDAANLYSDLVARSPGDAERRVALAFSLERAGRLREAEAVYRTTLDEVGTSARIALAHLLNGIRRHEDAWQALQAAPRSSGDGELARLRARTALWSGRLETAIGLFEALGTNRTSEDDRYERDLARQLATTNVAAADGIFERLLTGNRLDRVGRISYADSLTARRRFDDAWRALEGVEPVDDDIVDRRARLAVWSKRFAMARPLLNEWLLRHPDDAERWLDAAEVARQLQDPSGEAAALASYLERRPGDRNASVRHAQLLERAGQAERALTIYRAVLDAEPGRSELARTAGYLAEQQGDRADAIRLYTRAWDAVGGGDAALALTIARLQRPSSPADSLLWYQRASSVAGAAEERRQTLVDLARTEGTQGRTDRALAYLAEALIQSPTDPDALTAAAAIESSRGNAGATVTHLARLESVRPLTLDEERWLAGQLRLAGDVRASRERWERIADKPAAGATDWQTVGDLRAEAGRPTDALAAYARAETLGAPETNTLAQARVLAKVGRFAEAAQAYDRYLRRGTPDGKRVELARIHLAAGDHEAATRWAREATTGDERGVEADLVLAQALHLSNRRDDSERVIATLPSTLPPSTTVLEQAGQLAAARDEHLEGIRWFDRALGLRPATDGELYYWRGLSWLKRGDYRRSLDSLNQARTRGAMPELEQSARAAAIKATAPALWLPTRFFSDSNDVTSAATGVGVSAWPGRAFPLSVEALAGTLQQRRFSVDRTRATVGVPRAFVLPRLAVGGSVGAERYGGRDARWVGDAHATYLFEDHTSLRLDVRRDTIWSDRDRRDPRAFTRGYDLASLGPGFTMRGGDATLDVALARDRQARVQVGRNGFQDGNTQSVFYGHYQFVTTDRPGVWTALRPNVYWESFGRRSSAYFSPSGFVTLGNMWHTIRTPKAWRLEAEVNPRLTLLNARVSSGVHGLLDVSRGVGPLTVGGGAFAFYDRRSDYWSWRVTGQVGLRLAR